MAQAAKHLRKNKDLEALAEQEKKEKEEERIKKRSRSRDKKRKVRRGTGGACGPCRGGKGRATGDPREETGPRLSVLSGANFVLDHCTCTLKVHKSPSEEEANAQNIPRLLPLGINLGTVPLHLYTLIKLLWTRKERLCNAMHD